MAPERRVGVSQSGSNTWLAIDAATAPTLRAQELRFAWERFLGEDDEGNVRGPIVDSWRRSQDARGRLVASGRRAQPAGVAPTGRHLAPVIADEEEIHELYEEHPLGRHTQLIH